MTTAAGAQLNYYKRVIKYWKDKITEKDEVITGLKKGSS